MSRPNVLIIYPDQMRYDAMGCAGNPVLKTPGLDRLSSEGVHFSNAYTSFPLCCPFRASMLTGKYATSHGMMANHYPIALEQSFLPEIMRSNGYLTAWVGKWHLNGGKKHDFVPNEYRLGFEHFIGFSRGHEYSRPIYYRDDNTTPFKSDMFEPDLQTYHLLDFIDSATASHNPFFAAVGYGVPHPPLELSPAYYRRLYRPQEIPDSPLVCDKDKALAKEFVAKYYGMIAATDYQIQRIMNHLEYRDILNNTMIILVSDHGEMAYDHRLTGKKCFYNASMHVPFIIRLPALGAPRRETQVVDPSVDIMPTVLQVCGISIPEEVEGCSLQTLLKSGEDASLPNCVFYQIPIEREGPEKHPCAERGIRTADTLYIEVDAVPSYLFDLTADPGESNNLIDCKAHQVRQTAMKEKLQQTMAQYGDHWKREAVFPPVNFQTHEEGAAYNKIIYSHAVYEPQNK